MGLKVDADDVDESSLEDASFTSSCVIGWAGGSDSESGVGVLDGHMIGGVSVVDGLVCCGASMVGVVGGGGRSLVTSLPRSYNSCAAGGHQGWWNQHLSKTA